MPFKTVNNASAEVIVVSPLGTDLLPIVRNGQTYPFYVLADSLGSGLETVLPPERVSFSAQSNNLYHVDTTTGALTALMPLNPQPADIVAFVDTTGEFATNNFTVNLNGADFQGSPSDIVMAIAYGFIKIQFNGIQWVQIP